MTRDRTLDRLLADRWSCRAFRPEPVGKDTIERILTLTQRTSSWCNTQPWQVIVTMGEETERFRAGLLRASEGADNSAYDLPSPSYEGVYLERRRDVGWRLYDAVGVKRGDRQASARQGRENFRLFGAPHVAIVSSPRALGPYGALDCGGFIQVFLLAAEAEGVATIAQAAIASQTPFVRRHFGLDEDRIVLCGISFGYADMDHPSNTFRAPRASLSEVVTWKGEPA
jgi:nitroreductase